MADSIRDTILSADDLATEDHEVPEWGVTVQIRSLDGTGRDAYEALLIALRKGGTDIELKLADYRSKLVARCLFDPGSGERIFTTAEASKLGSKSSVVIDRLYEVARRLSGMTEGAVEEAKGNSGAAPSGSSTSA